ncbi:MAG: hypothetical protein ACP5H0_07580 [Caldisericum sp.]|uniref:hypothetical protein n=1 Tax=Caldisericum sp. TaxID=2499687 RepID=UPI003D0A0921
MRKVLAILLVLALVGVSIIGSVKSATNPFSESAELFLKSHQEAITSLRGAELISPMVYKDKDGKDRVIVYGVKRGEEIVGRIVVNNNVKNPTVLEFAESVPPHLSDIKEEILNKTSLEKNIVFGKPEFIYVFPLLYYVHLNVYDKSRTAKEIYFFWNERKIITLKDIPDFPILAYNKLPLMKQKVSGSFGSYKILSDVPDYSTSTTNLCNSCGPVAGANILGYWHKHGYYYVQHDWDESNGNGLITCLWYDMNKSCIYGTPASNFRSGIVYHANTVHRDYLGIYHFSASGDSSPHFSDAVNEISYDRPFGILVRKQGSWTWWHWITCIGYYSGYGEYIYVRDGWGDGTVAINWNASSLPDPDHPGQYIPIFIDGFDYVFPSY